MEAWEARLAVAKANQKISHLFAACGVPLPHLKKALARRTVGSRSRRRRRPKRPPQAGGCTPPALRLLESGPGGSTSNPHDYGRGRPRRRLERVVDPRRHRCWHCCCHSRRALTARAALRAQRRNPLSPLSIEGLACSNKKDFQKKGY